MSTTGQAATCGQGIKDTQTGWWGAYLVEGQCRVDCWAHMMHAYNSTSSLLLGRYLGLPGLPFCHCSAPATVPAGLRKGSKGFRRVHTSWMNGMRSVRIMCTMRHWVRMPTCLGRCGKVGGPASLSGSSACGAGDVQSLHHVPCTCREWCHAVFPVLSQL